MGKENSGMTALGICWFLLSKKASYSSGYGFSGEITGIDSLDHLRRTKQNK